jgi:hypothetical protein
MYQEQGKASNSMNIYPRFAMPSGSELHTPIVYVKETVAWEYKRIERDEAEAPLNEEELNAFGAEGWELVSVVAVAATAYFYFKRLSS